MELIKISFTDAKQYPHIIDWNLRDHCKQIIALIKVPYTTGKIVKMNGRVINQEALHRYYAPPYTQWQFYKLPPNLLICSPRPIKFPLRDSRQFENNDGRIIYYSLSYLTLCSNAFILERKKVRGIKQLYNLIARERDNLHFESCDRQETRH